MSQPYDLQKLWEACNYGLDYFHEIYPDSTGKENKSKHFKTHNENTPSTTLSNKKNADGVYSIYNHATKEHYNAIDHVMREHSYTFLEACEYLFDKYGLQKSQNTLYKPEKTWTDEHDKKEDYWKITPHKKAQGFEFFAPFLTEKTCKEYHFTSLEGFESVKAIKDTGKTSLLTVLSTPEYPIFAYNELKTFAKIYEPKASKNTETGYSTKHHFLGTKPERYIYGWNRIFEKIGEETIEVIEEFLKELKKTKDKKEKNIIQSEIEELQLSAVFIATGGSDGLNLASLGYDVIWFNSEAEIINSDEYYQLKKIAKHIYYIPDLDKTGKDQAFKMGMQHLDIKMIWLPDELWEVDKKKDLADWVKKHKALGLDVVKGMFAKIITQAKPFKFWAFNGDRGVYTIDNNLLLNFLNFHGFRVREKIIKGVSSSKPLNDRQIVQIKDNVVKGIPYAVDIRRYVLKWIEDNFLDRNIFNAVSKTTFFSENNAWQLINKQEIELKYSHIDYQRFFFRNKVVEVSKESIKSTSLRESKDMVWEADILLHNIELSKNPPFEIKKDENGNYTIDVFNTNSNYFKVLINTSRMFWKKDDNNGFDTNNFSITSKNLTPEENQHQQLQLINKIYTVGYILHQYKSLQNAYFPIGTDYKIGASTDENNGGSGKTFIINSLQNIINNWKKVDGKEMIKDDGKFIFDGVTDETNIVFFNDLHKAQDFEYFFNKIDGDITVNNKGGKRFELLFKESPKMVATSNYVPTKIDGALRRRLLVYQCSDYYHEKGNDYDKTRKISDSFNNREILNGADYPTNELNEDFNFWFYCLQFYLQSSKKIDAPEENFVIRSIRQKIGDHLLDFFAEYFDEKDEEGNYINRNTWILKKEMLDEYNELNGKYAKTANNVKEALQDYCKIKGWELKIQKKPHINSSSGKRGAVEHIYINTTSEVIPKIPTEQEQNPLGFEVEDPNGIKF